MEWLFDDLNIFIGLGPSPFNGPSYLIHSHINKISINILYYFAACLTLLVELLSITDFDETNIFFSIGPPSSPSLRRKRRKNPEKYSSWKLLEIKESESPLTIMTAIKIPMKRWFFLFIIAVKYMKIDLFYYFL